MVFMIIFYFQICEKFDAAMSKISNLEEENKQLREETEKFDANQKNFEKNISSLLVTARSELNRKEREIKALRYGICESRGLGKPKIENKTLNIFLPISFNICFVCSKDSSH